MICQSTEPGTESGTEPGTDISNQLQDRINAVIMSSICVIVKSRLIVLDELIKLMSTFLKNSFYIRNSV